MDYLPNHAVIAPSDITDIAQDGITLWYNRASSYRYEGAFDRTYFSYTNSETQVVLRYYDHDSGVLSGEVIIAELDKRSDDHLSPAITIVENGPDAGKILLAFSHHSSDMFIYQSDAAESIDGFTQTGFLDGYYTYPAFIQDELTGDIQLFFREGIGGAGNPKGQYNHITSDDSGASWGTPDLGIGFDNPWFTYGLPPQIEGDEIFVAFTYSNTALTEAPNDLGYSISTDGGQTWLSTEGVVDELRPNTVVSLGGLQNHRLIDSVYYEGEWFVSLTQFAPEYQGLGTTAVGKIVRAIDGAVLFETNVAVNYYVDGIHFDNVDPRLFYYSTPNDNVNGGGNIMGVLMDETFTAPIFETLFVSNENGYAIRPSSAEGAQSLGEISWIDTREYTTYFDFDTGIAGAAGGAGIYDFSLATKGARADLSDNSQNLGAAFEVDLSTYNSLVGTLFSDSLRGDAGDNTLWGYGARDYLSGYGGNDRLEGGAGDDYLSGGGGDDVLAGGDGADTLVGGAGFDFADYTGAAPVAADLIDISLNSGGAFGDDLQSIEGLIGTKGDDVLGGSGFDNTLIGGAGDDMLIGRGGDDILSGGAGDDALLGGRGADLFDGGEGFDVADYSGGSSVRADLADASINSGLAIGDSYISIEGLIGSADRDSLRGDGGDNVIDGGASRDFISGRDGDDTLIGGTGDDFIWGNAGADIFMFSQGDGADDVRDFDVFEDSLAFDFDYDAGSFSLSQGASGIDIDYGSGSIFLRGVTLAEVSAVYDSTGDGFVLTFEAVL